MAKLSRINNRRCGAVLFRDTEDEMHVGYRPSAFTEELNDAVQEQALKAQAQAAAGESKDKGKDKPQVSGNVMWLEAMVVDWNLEEDDDTPIPVTRENLQGLDIPLQPAIVQAITEDIKTGESSRMPSTASS